MNDYKPILLLFMLSCAGVLGGILTRLGYNLGKDQPPADLAQRAVWRRKRTWVAVGEICTIPLLGAGWTAACSHFSFSLPIVVGGAMVLGALGFGFLLDAVQKTVTRKLENA